MPKQKTAVIFHGFPHILSEDNSPLLKFFISENYKVIMPNLIFDIDHFDTHEIKKYIKDKLREKNPDVIVGVSMGGLLAPHLAKEYPNTKLILVASGPKLKTKIPVFNFLVHLEKHDRSLLLWRLVKKIPKAFYFFIYRLFSKHKNTMLSKADLDKNADDNWSVFQKIPLSKIKSLLKFVTETDNTKLLSETENDTLILAGKSDKLMPFEQTRKMADSIKNSRIITADRSHNDAFQNSDYAYLYNFLD